MTSRTPAAHPTVLQRRAIGKNARSVAALEAHGVWAPGAGRRDPVDLLEEQTASRVPELVPIHYGRMLVSPFAFYRGAAALMAADLATTPSSRLRVQLCGDAHLDNLGGFASPERELVFDVNDFDETLPGPFEWDVKRLAASFEIAGRERGFRAKERRFAVLATVAEYRRAMRVFAEQDNLEVWYSRMELGRDHVRWAREAGLPKANSLASRFENAPTRDNLRALEKMTRRVDGQLRIVAHPPLVVPVEDLAGADAGDRIEESMRAVIRSYRRTMEGDRRHLLEGYSYQHMARKVVGVGSVGTRAWVILLLGRDDADPLFLQGKEAQASVLEPYLGKSEFKNQGQRVVEGQRRLQATSDIFLGWDRVPGPDGIVRDFYVRQLWDWKVALDVAALSHRDLARYGQMCGWTLARGHARTGDRVAISSYLGRSDRFEGALAVFASAYADQNERDFRALGSAARSGRVVAQTGI